MYNCDMMCTYLDLSTTYIHKYIYNTYLYESMSPNSDTILSLRRVHSTMWKFYTDSSSGLKYSLTILPTNGENFTPFTLISLILQSKQLRCKICNISGFLCVFIKENYIVRSNGRAKYTLQLIPWNCN